LTGTYVQLMSILRYPQTMSVTHIFKHLLPFKSKYYYSSRSLISACIYAILTAFCPPQSSRNVLSNFSPPFPFSQFPVLYSWYVILRFVATKYVWWEEINILTNEFISILNFSDP